MGREWGWNRTLEARVEVEGGGGLVMRFVYGGIEKSTVPI